MLWFQLQLWNGICHKKVFLNIVNESNMNLQKKHSGKSGNFLAIFAFPNLVLRPFSAMEKIRQKDLVAAKNVMLKNCR